MISQSLYLDLRGFVPPLNSEELIKNGLDRFVKPYVLVIHQPSGRGFYLDREYRHILDISNCQEPQNPVEVARHHLCASSDLPIWVRQELSCTADHRCYDSFWLY